MGFVAHSVVPSRSTHADSLSAPGSLPLGQHKVSPQPSLRHAKPFDCFSGAAGICDEPLGEEFPKSSSSISLLGFVQFVFLSCDTARPKAVPKAKAAARLLAISLFVIF